MCEVLWLQNNHGSLRSQLTVLPAVLPYPRWPTWSLLSTLGFHQSCLCSLLLFLYSVVFSLCVFIILWVVFLFTCSWAPNWGLVFLKETVSHALKQTDDLHSQELCCWDLHLLAVTVLPRLQWPPFSLLVTSAGFSEPDFYHILIRRHGLPVFVLNEWCFSCGIFQEEGFLMGFELLKIEYDFSQEKYNDTWGLSAGIA